MTTKERGGTGDTLLTLQKTSAVLLLGVLTACGTAQNSAPEANGHASSITSVPNSPPAPSKSITSAPVCQLRGASLTANKRMESGSVNISDLVGRSVRTGSHTRSGECFERFVIEMKGNPQPAANRPGIQARYIKTPTQEGSGEAVAMQGNAFLEITLGAWMYKFGGGEGPNRYTPKNVTHIKEVRLTQNFEGYTTWVIGVDATREFVVHDIVKTEGCKDMCVAVDLEVPTTRQ